MAASCSAFEDAEQTIGAVLRDLAREHERQVQVLKSEIAALRDSNLGQDDTKVEKAEKHKLFPGRPAKLGAISTTGRAARNTTFLSAGSAQEDPELGSSAVGFSLDEYDLGDLVIEDEVLSPSSRGGGGQGAELRSRFGRKKSKTLASDSSFGGDRPSAASVGTQSSDTCSTFRRHRRDLSDKIVLGRMNSKSTLSAFSNLGGVDRQTRIAKWIEKTCDGMEQGGDRHRAKCLRLVASQKFDTGMGLIIMCNSLLIGLEVMLVSPADRDATLLDPNPESLPFLVLENIFLVVYLMEIGLRFYAIRWEAFASGWVKFDLMLVILGVLGSWVIPIIASVWAFGGSEVTSIPMVLRVFRLARLARALRLFVQFRTLWMLVHGLISSVSTIFNVFLVLTLTLYIFSCIGSEMITNNPLAKEGGEFEDLVQRYWRNLPMCMLTLIQFVSFDGIGVIYAPMIQEDPVLLFFFVPFLLIVSIVLMNLVTAIIVEAFLEHAKQDNELKQKEEERKIQAMMPHLQQMFQELDTDGSGKLTLDELVDAPARLKEELSACLDADSLTELWDILDSNGDGQVDSAEFCDGVLKLSLSNQPLEFLRIMKQILYLREDVEKIVGKITQQQSVRLSRMRTALEEQRKAGIMRSESSM